MTDDAGQEIDIRAEAPKDGAQRSETAPPAQEQPPQAQPAQTQPAQSDGAHGAARQEDKPKVAAKQVSPKKVEMQSRLPALDDDADVGVQKEHVVTRDDKADLRFNGALLASAAPATAPDGHWQEYRIYQTEAGKHVFSKVSRSVYVQENDTHEADVFDPAPTSTTTQLLRSAREIARAKPLTWMDAAVAFFGYDPLAKALYRKLSVHFEEQIA